MSMCTAFNMSTATVFTKKIGDSLFNSMFLYFFGNSNLSFEIAEVILETESPYSNMVKISSR